MVISNAPDTKEEWVCFPSGSVVVVVVTVHSNSSEVWDSDHEWCHTRVDKVPLVSWKSEMDSSFVVVRSVSPHPHISAKVIIVCEWKHTQKNNICAGRHCTKLLARLFNNTKRHKNQTKWLLKGVMNSFYLMLTKGPAILALLLLDFLRRSDLYFQHLGSFSDDIVGPELGKSDFWGLMNTPMIIIIVIIIIHFLKWFLRVNRQWGWVAVGRSCKTIPAVTPAVTSSHFPNALIHVSIYGDQSLYLSSLGRRF